MANKTKKQPQMTEKRLREEFEKERKEHAQIKADFLLRPFIAKAEMELEELLKPESLHDDENIIEAAIELAKWDGLKSKVEGAKKELAELSEKYNLE